MKILIVTDAWEPQINGVVRTYQNLLAQLIKKGHEVKIIGPNSFTSFPMPGYKEISLTFFPYRHLKRIIPDYNPDAIHIAVEGPLGWAARRWCINHKKPFTTSFHTHFPDYVAKRIPSVFGSKCREWCKQICIKTVRHFHAPAKATFVATQSLEDQLRQWGFQQKMVRLVRGVNTDVFHPGEKILFKGYPSPVMLYVGRIAIEKNIEAFLNIQTTGTKVVVGGGPDLDKLKSQYPHVIFAGLQQGHDLADHYRSADLFVFPSKTDTFGMVLIEALACGLPVAGYDVTGPKDIINEPFLGATHDNLQQAVDRALACTGTKEERFDHIRRCYSWDEVADVFSKTSAS